MASAAVRLHAQELRAARGREGEGAAPLLARFERLRGDACPWLLDSALADGRLGRFSFAGADPWAVLRAHGRSLVLEVHRAAHPDHPVGVHRREGDALAWLRELVPSLAPEADAARLPFVGGAVGWLGYELAAQLEPVRFPDAEGPRLPDLAFLLVDSLLALDHETGRLLACGLGFGRDAAAAERAARRRSSALACRVSRPVPPARPEASRARSLRRCDARWYEDAFAAVKRGIEAGDLYQACLTHRIDVAFDGDPWPLYRRLRRANPAPFAAYLALPEAAVLSSSPERFLRVETDGSVEARPIKGTRDLAPSPAESRRALADSAKDRAENVMIVDLYRNDLGRVCEPGSVRVPELCAIERYATLHQMVSTVTGRLAPGRDRLDLVRAAFPPGSMTGAPKIAAMRLLAALEPARRGVYAGALGYLDARGGMDLSVVIRTIVVAEGRACVHVGGGIVADSEAAAEWQESLVKARALLEALEAVPARPARRAAGEAAPAAAPEP